MRSALSVHAERGSLAVARRRAVRRHAVDEAGRAALLADWSGGGHGPRHPHRGAGDDRAVVPQPARASSVLPASEAGVADVIGAARLLVSEDALAELAARAKGERTEPEEDA